MNTQTDVRYLTLCKDADALLTTGTISAYTDLNDGQLAIVTEGNAALASGDGQNADTKLRLVVRNGAGLFYSPFFRGRQIKDARYKDRVAEVTQISYIGYNGTAGSFDALSEVTYNTTLNFIEGGRAGQNPLQNLIQSSFKSDSSATQYKVSLGVAEPLASTLYNKPHEDVIVERVNSGAQTAIGTGVDNVTFTKGSKYISCDGLIDDATGSTALAAGVILVVGAASTSAVYKIISIDGTADTAVLDTPFRGATTTIVDTSLRQIVAASEGDYGVKFSAQTGEFAVGTIPYRLVRFELFTENYETATVTHDTVAVPAVGSANQISWEEWFCQVNEKGGASRNDHMYSSRSVVDSAVTYNQLEILIEDDHYTSLTQSAQRKQIKVAVPYNMGTLTKAAIQAVLDDVYAAFPA